MRKKLFIILFLHSQIATSQNTWLQKLNFGGAARRSAIGFSIGNYGYMGTGYNANFFKDFWQYDLTTNTWAQKADFAGTERFSAVAFTVDNFAFVGTGYDVLANFQLGDFYKYDAVANSWSQVSSMPAGAERRYACAFSAKQKGYVTTGVGSSGYMDDLWEYNPLTDTWTQKTNFPGGVRYECTAFTIADRGYVACGAFAGTVYTDLYEYEPTSDSWTQRANFPGTGGDGAAGFAIGNKGYIGTGSTQSGYPVDFYEWDKATDAWTAKANFPAAGRAFGTGFAIQNKGYIGIGEATNYFNDFWEYTPDSGSVGVNEVGNENIFFALSSIGKHRFVFRTNADFFPLKINVYNMNGRKVFSDAFENCSEMVFEINLSEGNYLYSLQSAENNFSGKVLVVD